MAVTSAASASAGSWMTESPLPLWVMVVKVPKRSVYGSTAGSVVSSVGVAAAALAGALEALGVADAGAAGSVVAVAAELEAGAAAGAVVSAGSDRAPPMPASTRRPAGIITRFFRYHGRVGTGGVGAGPWGGCH